MNNHRELLVQQFRDLIDQIDESISYIPDHEIEWMVREMATILEHAERHIDEEG